MIECIKSAEIRDALKNESDSKNVNLLRDLFVEIPTLKSVGFCKSNEYNDNNYSDYFKITSINGVNFESDYSDDYYVDEEGNEIKDLPKEMPDKNYEVPFIINTLESLSSEEYGYDDHLETRESVLSTPRKKESKDKAFNAYYIALKTGEKVNDLSVFKNNPNWALYYSMDVLKSRLPRELESVFKKDIKYAYYYATNVIKGNLPEMIENHFLKKAKNILLETFDKDGYVNPEDKYYLRKYVEFTNGSKK
jgi:hypothetical protein